MSDALFRAAGGARLFTGPVGTPIGGPGWVEVSYVEDGEAVLDEFLGKWALRGLGADGIVIKDNINPAAVPTSWVRYHWFEQETARFKYKPNFTLSVRPGSPFQAAILRIEARVMDARWEGGPNQVGLRPPMITIAASMTIDDDLYQEPDLFAEWLLNRIHKVEEHETEEWFRRDGGIYRDPHLEKQKLPVGPINSPDDSHDDKPVRLTLRQRLAAWFARS